MGQRGGASWWRVCYQQCLPRLVFMDLAHINILTFSICIKVYESCGKAEGHPSVRKTRKQRRGRGRIMHQGAQITISLKLNNFFFWFMHFFIIICLGYIQHSLFYNIKLIKQVVNQLFICMHTFPRIKKKCSSLEQLYSH